MTYVWVVSNFISHNPPFFIFRTWEFCRFAQKFLLFFWQLNKIGALLRATTLSFFETIVALNKQ